MSYPILDSHVHLWPASAANADGHAWMETVPQLATQHVLTDYHRTVSGDDDGAAAGVEGVVYVETDRRRRAEDGSLPLEEWAAGPLDEIRFLRSVVEGDARETRSDLLRGIVAWAPVDRGPDVLERWLALAGDAAGPATWARVRGFRSLLQGITDRAAFERLVFGREFLDVMVAFGAGDRDYVFDVGIDAHGGGTWQLEAWVKVLEQVNGGGRSGTRFVMNHLCKPDLTGSDDTAAGRSDDFRVWAGCIKMFASYPKVYMKLSGAFSELSDDRVATTSAEEIAAKIRPWTDVIFDAFGADRIMFGSDWPVCNIRGPAGAEPWSVWKDVVGVVVEQRGLSPEQRRRVWSGTAKEAYRLQ